MPDTQKKRGGTVRTTVDRCKGCGYCIEFCPTKCLSFSKQYNRKGYRFPVLSVPDKCTGCDLCGMYCPDFAIFGYSATLAKGQLCGGSASETGGKVNE